MLILSKILKYSISILVLVGTFKKGKKWKNKKKLSGTQWVKQNYDELGWQHFACRRMGNGNIKTKF